MPMFSDELYQYHLEGWRQIVQKIATEDIRTQLAEQTELILHRMPKNRAINYPQEPALVYPSPLCKWIALHDELAARNRTPEPEDIPTIERYDD
jgi:hypothetical protein